MIGPVLVGLLLTLLVVPAWQTWRARKRLLSRLRSEWGHPREGPRDMDGVADFFRSQDLAGAFLDDRTWNDLLMDDVFVCLDRTESSVGQQMLYYRLRSASAPRTLDAFDALMVFMEGDAARRERAQVTLGRLRSPSGY